MSLTYCSHYSLWQENSLSQFVFNLLTYLPTHSTFNLVYIVLQRRMLTTLTFVLLKTVFLLTENTTHPFFRVTALRQVWEYSFLKEWLQQRRDRGGVILPVVLKLHWKVCLALVTLLKLLSHQIVVHLSYKNYLSEWDLEISVPFLLHALL